MFKGLRMSVARDHGIPKKQLLILKDRFIENGGIVAEDTSTNTSDIRIILTSNPQRHILDLDLELELSRQLVTADWISDSLEQQKRLPFPVFVLPKTSAKRRNSSKDSKPQSPQKKSKVETLVEMANIPVQHQELVNDTEMQKQGILKEFKQLLQRHISEGDHIRIRAYRLAINAIAAFKGEIYSVEDLRGVPGIGAKSLDKVREIIESGSLLKNEYEPPGKKEVLLFQGIYNVGAKTARDWYMKGFKTLQDIKDNSVSLGLTPPQLTGLKYYDDFATRIPRDEVAQIGARVKESLSRIDPLIDTMLLGSYRRGAVDSSDVDLLLYPTVKSHTPCHDLLVVLATTLKQEGFIIPDGDLRLSPKVYNGLCRLETGEYSKGPVRRIDFLLCADLNLLGAYQLHFTGNEMYNRNLRQLATNKGMILSQHGLRFRGVNKDEESEFVAGETEESILSVLGVTYLPPEDRNKG